MRLKSPAIRLIALFAGILTTAMICSSAFTANAYTVPTREEAIDSETDLMLHKANPELNNRKLRSDDYGYINEWKAIRRVVQQEMKPAASECAGDQYWELRQYDGINGLRPHASLTFDRIADAIFYNRHPELAGASISSSDSALAREWSRIRQAIRVEQPCS